jgi:hypothetical protein
MAKKQATKRKPDETTTWNADDHADRKHKQLKKLDHDKLEKREQRTALLTRDSKAKREQGKLRLHLVKTQRQIDKLRPRLLAWDDVDEQKRRKKELEQERKMQEDEANPPKRKGRKGPETWKLKGAARPAWQVYDFDTRYVDPHIKAHEEARTKTQRCRNLLSLYKGRFGEETTSGIPQPECREFLSLLMQAGHLNLQAKNFKASRQHLLECMELDSETHPVTPARCHLMRLYIEANRPDSARRLWEKLPETDTSVWIRYSAALVEYISWKILEEEGSTQATAESHLAKAIQSNLFCAYHLAFCDTFHEAMDYTEDIEDAHEGKPLEEAIEYCNSEQMGAWQGTEGALEWVRDVVLKAIHGFPIAGGELSPSDLEWKAKLMQCREDPKAETAANESEDERSAAEAESETSEGDNEDESEAEADVDMFIGMFQTAMEMLENTGELERRPQA